MKHLINILLINLLCSTIQAQSNQTIDSIVIQRIDTICNYIVTRSDYILTLPDNFNFSSNQRGYVLLEFTIESEKVKSWKIDLFRILEKDSIIRNYSVFIDKTTPSDIEALTPAIEKIVNNIRLKAIDKENIDQACKIGFKFDLIKQ